MSSRQPVPRVRITQQSKRKWYAVFGLNSWLISILLHLLFGVTATCLVVAHFQKPKHVNFQAAPPVQHNEVEHKVEVAKRTSVESAPPDLKRITTTGVSAIALPEVPALPPPDEATPTTISGVDGVMDSGTSGLGMGGNGEGGNGVGSGSSSPFGSVNGAGLAGYLHDFKQTPDRKPTEMLDASGNFDLGRYDELLRDYMNENWDDKMFDKYYKSRNMLHLSRLVITGRQSEAAPAAFHLENEMLGGMWAIHYHGKVASPTGGDYQFVGGADNIVVVRIRGRVVLDAGITELTSEDDLHQPFNSTWIGNKKTAPVFQIKLKQGPVFHMEPGEPTDMDVLIGDDGGYCAFYLLVMKVGNTYDKAEDGTLKLPFFQIGDQSAPHFDEGEEVPPFSLTPEPWQIINDTSDPTDDLQNLGN